MSTTLLVVDDDPQIRTSLTRALSSGTVDVVTAESAEQALGLIASSAPDVVLSDIRMSGMSGLDLKTFGPAGGRRP